MTAFLIFLAAGIGTFAIRLSGVLLLRDRELPPRIAKGLSLVGPAAMAAIVANALLLDEGAWRGFGAWHLAALVAIGVAVWRRTSGVAMAAGAVAFAALLLAGL
ncbi:AzlD domain-containing protein [Demequina lignilytica]|uniref:AzlD domain-containing protein n=1 Tax=Demequina lignilytica TaxID=3051663 RepID=A0AAW7MA78_9MICO|nr:MULTISPECIES: AzlD domain-containing protein [unclassified Demequina]MDN4478624.1 AzlD domain-containing protein [Demequina sp. SYSU T00039-1]MDN4483816.1 AzlD domain-containing protein [Demequina sp. SYSU T0a273]MDN4488602.1 AzlD domain-containing protein [Demequina sp. SYSU T00039]